MSWRSPRLAGLCALSLIGAAATSGCGGGGDAGDAAESTTTFQLTPLRAKDPTFTIGALDIVEPGKTVEILELRPIGTPNVAYLGAITVWPRDESGPEAALGFPSDDIPKHHPAIGTVVPAAETAFVRAGQERANTLWVGAGFRLISGTVGGVFDVEVVYRVDGKKRSERSNAAFLVCMAPCEGNKYRNVKEWAAVMRKDLGVEKIKTSG